MKILGDINHGGFGRVERVELADGKIVARKVFRPNPLAFYDPDTVEKLRKRFAREVKVQSVLSQRNRRAFVPVLASSLEQDPPWFTMPLASKNLEEQIAEDRKAGRISPGPLAAVMTALEELHALDYVHRDLKPQNVLLVGKRWKLSDFGLVLEVTTSATTKLTSTGSGWGSQPYCAPEQHVDFGHVTSAADIYAFGCILHDVAVGTPRIPYNQQTGPGALGRIIEKCTDRDPAKRFPNVTALRGALLAVLSTPQDAAKIDTESVEWGEQVAAIEPVGWDVEKLRKFVRYLQDDGTTVLDLWAPFAALDENAITALHGVEPQLWAQVARAYCNWAAHKSFDFDYCDVVILRLEVIEQLATDVGLKACVAIAAAELGASHNRWFVMGRVTRICGLSCPDEVAERIALEIKIEGAEQHFRRCAERSGAKLEVYHQAIRKVIDPAEVAMAIFDDEDPEEDDDEEG